MEKSTAQGVLWHFNYAAPDIIVKEIRRAGSYCSVLNILATDGGVLHFARQLIKFYTTSL